MTHLELLESRQLLSGALAHDYLRVLAADPKGPVDDGFTPAQIDTAYGYDLLGNASQRGAGQTIAIVDAFDDPKIIEDLGVFDRQFGLAAPPSLVVTNQTGGSKLPKSNAGWASEISLDVEWAHAMAPAANILLVEAKSDSRTNLLAAAAFAGKAPDVSSVSMSWGFNESASQLKWDSMFLTPAGHTGVTFVAAGGDNGAKEGAGWPADSPNVLSVGGTHLQLAADNTIQRETSWTDTGGGYSRYEAQPVYQSAAQNSGMRSSPDVAYDADPDTGFAVYDSVPYQGETGWQEIAGNSAGAPQWAAIIAIANQARASSGLGALDGARQVMPALYSVYTGPAGAGSAAYAQTFNDIHDGRNANRTDGASTEGYDAVTGLGSPKVPAVVDLLGTTTIDQIPAAVQAPLGVTFVATSPLIIAPGKAIAASVNLTDPGAARLTGSIQITLYASSDPVLDASDTLLPPAMAAKTMRLSANSHKRISLRFRAPSDQSAGTYFILARVTFTPLVARALPATVITFIGTSAAGVAAGR